MNAAPRRLPTAGASWAVAVAVIAATQLALGAALVKPYDEGLVLYGGWRVAHGDVPYRDFWSMYAPASFYVLAGLDRLLSESVLVGRVYDALARAAVVALAYALIRRRAGRKAATVGAAAVWTLLVIVREYLFVALPATAGAMATLLALDRADRGTRSANEPAGAAATTADEARRWWLPGALAGATTLFRHDFGVATAIACACALLAMPAAQRGRRALAFVAGVGIVVVPALAGLLAVVPAHELVQDLVRMPSDVYVVNRELPFPLLGATVREAVAYGAVEPLLALLVYAPPIVVAAGTIAIAAGWRRRAAAERRDGLDPLALATLALVALLSLKGAVRVQLLHFVPALSLAIVALAWLLAPALAARARARAVAEGLGAVVVAIALLGVAARVQRHGGPPDIVASPRAGDVTDSDRLGRFALEDARADVLAYLGTHAHAGDTLYVGAGRHDKLLMNNVELYFLSGLPAATKWHDLHPGVQTTAAVQREMIDAMTRRPPAFVVLNTQWDDMREPNGSAASSGVVLLDGFLRERFAPVFRAGTFTILAPRAGGAARR